MTSLEKNFAPKRWPRYTWFGVAVLLGGQLALMQGGEIAATWHTPIMWTGYILIADGLLARIRGRSWLTSRRLEFPFLVLMSVLIWLIFEVYNFRLQNWMYRGLPTNPGVLDFGYFWSFATILPAILITSEIVGTLLPDLTPSKDRSTLRLGPDWFWVLLGLALVTIPPLLPISVARYTFGLVWIGFIPLLDPVNQQLGNPTLRRDLERWNLRPIIALLVGGLLCGLLWEAWNYQAFKVNGGHWIYTVPEALRIFGWHYGKMPLLGMLGFPPFAVELYVFYLLMRRLLGIEKIFNHWELLA